MGAKFIGFSRMFDLELSIYRDFIWL